MIYFDHASTTQVKPIALSAIEKAPIGNPNSLHSMGIESKKTLLNAEQIVKNYINGHDGRIIWLNTASLANYFVIDSVLKTNQNSAFACMSTAHKSIKKYAKSDMQMDPLESGLISIKKLTNLVTEETKLFSILYVNNETGVIQPVELIKPKLKKALYHIDAVQAAGKIPINIQKMGCDFLTMSGHKFGTPKGIACLWIKNGIQLDLPYLGTPPVPLAYAFAKTLSSIDLTKRKVDIILKEQFFKNRLIKHAKRLDIEYDYNIKTIRRLPGILSMRFKGIDSSELLMNLSDKGLAVSSGSACNSREIIPSHVLTGMGISSKNALCTIRISLSPENTWEELEKGAIILTDVIKDMHHD